MHARLLHNLALTVAAAGLVACASAGPASNADNGNARYARNVAAASLPGKPGCFWLRNVYDWTVLNNSELIVHAPLQQNAYLVKLFEPVFDLNFHLNLGFQDVEHTGQICNDSMDYLLVPHYEPNRIPIVAVHRLTMPEQAALLKSAGRHLASSQRYRH